MHRTPVPKRQRQRPDQGPKRSKSQNRNPPRAAERSREATRVSHHPSNDHAAGVSLLTIRYNRAYQRTYLPGVSQRTRY